jgi:DMSO/TMAO reductase YedYZ molybdopterin-dependent catalytic subunit
MPSKVILFPLECSGNKRAYFRPKAFGEQWRDGDVTQLAWKGVPLADLLTVAGTSSEAVEVVFEGNDYGKEPDMENPESFARSLPVSKALHPGTIIAYELNGEEIPFEHGYPLRLIVPQWYGMASVKWLKRISVIDHKFEGHFQAVDYVYYPNKDNDEGKTPVTTINVSSIIQQPLNMQSLELGSHIIDGMAWTGEGKIESVEVSFDEGKSWAKANIKECGGEPYSCVMWYYSWNPEKRGEYTIMSRARDTEGRVQPMEAQWNRKGYGYNAVYVIKVKVE